MKEKSFNEKLECTKIVQTIDYFLVLLENLYPGTPLADDIAGTREPISDITIDTNPVKLGSILSSLLKCTY